MTISIKCPTCGSKLNGPDELAGKRVKCPKCSEPIAVPAVYEALPTEDAEERSKARRRKREQERSSVNDSDSVAPDPEDESDDDSEEEQVEVACPSCGELNYWPASETSEVGECHNCGETVVVPSRKQYEYAQRKKEEKRQLWKTWWPFAAGLGGLLLILIWISIDSAVSDFSPTDAYHAGYTYGSYASQHGPAAAKQKYAGTRCDPDYPAYRKHPKAGMAHQRGITDGLEGRPRNP